ncbi:MAG: 4Fe-4S binding protein [Candidatus Hydrothermarchaeota archaeon]|nr:4Fe-4S binding protein [Candidatus Hydrothermarchaeota archaeon]
MDEDRIEYLMRTEGEEIVFRRESVRDKRILVFNKDKCVGCWFCVDSCPVEAIEKNPIRNRDGEVIEHQNVIIDPEECVLCGICAELCVFDALRMTINDGSIKGLKGYPQYDRAYHIDLEKCIPKDTAKLELCKDCEIACPRGALKCSLVVKGEKGEKTAVKNVVERDENLCILCTTCKHACPEDAITVEKFFDGEIEVELEKCQGCGVCVEICHAKALNMPKPQLGKRVDTLVINHDSCMYCGACSNSCPTDALTVKRNSINFIKDKNTSTIKRRTTIFEELLSEVEEE